MSSLEQREIHVGYIPLLDCVAILWAKQQGYFDALGLQVHLHQEASWASLRDRLAYGFLDAAHCLSAMLPANALGQDQLKIQLQTPLVLSVNQAFISLRQELCYTLGIQPEDDEKTSSEKLTRALSNNLQVKLAYVYKYSMHHFCLKEWLAMSNINIAKQIQIQTSPPPLMLKGLRQEVFDGFCVGEPWNLQAQIEGYSSIIAASSHIIPAVADKVLAVTQEWAATHPNTLNALISAIKKAQQDLRCLSDLSDVWKMLKAYNIIQFDCSAKKHISAYHKIQNILMNLVTEDTTPQFNDFIWLIEQMQKWDELIISEVDKKYIARQCILTSST